MRKVSFNIFKRIQKQIWEFKEINGLTQHKNDELWNRFRVNLDFDFGVHLGKFGVNLKPIGICFYILHHLGIILVSFCKFFLGTHFGTNQ